MREYIKHPKLGKIPSSWKGSKLSEIVDLEHGFQFRKEDFTDSGIPVIKINNIIGNDLNLDNLSFIEPSRLEEFSRFLIKKNDILMSLTGNIGRVIEVGLIQRDFVQNYRVGKFVPVNRNELYNRYIKYLLSSPLVLSQFFKFSNQSAQANFGKQDMDKVWVAIPTSLPEQQKIAEILSTVDAKIEIIDQQISETQELKKGLMQQLLTKGIGHTEFKDSALGKIPKSWEVKELDEIGVELIDGDRGTNYPKSKDFSNEVYCLFLSAKNVTKNGFKFNECQFISEKKDKLLRKGKLSRNDFIITTRGSVGHVAFYDDSIPFKHVRLNSGMVILRDSKKNFETHFLYQFMKSPIFDSQVEVITSGSAQPQLTIKGLKKLKLPIPPLKEQLIIGEVLFIISNKLEVLSEKKITYQEMKQGLMQQLLTGKVRV